jgi:hypothetical protein
MHALRIAEPTRRDHRRNWDCFVVVWSTRSRGGRRSRRRYNRRHPLEPIGQGVKFAPESYV